MVLLVPKKTGAEKSSKAGDGDDRYSNPNLSRLSEWLVEAEKASLGSVPFDEILKFQSSSTTATHHNDRKVTKKKEMEEVMVMEDEDREDEESKNSVSTRSTTRSNRILGGRAFSRHKERIAVVEDDVRDDDDEEEEEVASQTSNSLVSTTSTRSSFRAPSILKKSSYGTISNKSSSTGGITGVAAPVPILRKKVQFSEEDEYQYGYDDDYDDDDQYSIHDNYRWKKVSVTVSLAKRKLGFRIVKKKGMRGIFLSDIHSDSPLAGTSLKCGMRIMKINERKVPDSIKEMVTVIKEEKYKSTLAIEAMERVKEDTFDQAMEDLGCKMYDFTEMEQDLEDGIDSVFGDGCVRTDTYCLLEDQMERFFDSIAVLHGCSSTTNKTSTKGRRRRQQQRHAGAGKSFN